MNWQNDILAIWSSLRTYEVSENTVCANYGCETEG